MERRSGRDEDAARSFAEAIEVWKPMADGNPVVPSLQAALCHEYDCLAASRRSLGREDEAERSMLLARGVIERLPDRGGNNLFALACVRARLAAMAGELGSMPADEARAERRRRVELAIDALRRAVAADYDDVASFRTNSDLAPLRDHAEFKAMLARLEESGAGQGSAPRAGQGRRLTTDRGTTIANAEIDHSPTACSLVRMPGGLSSARRASCLHGLQPQGRQTKRGLPEFQLVLGSVVVDFGLETSFPDIRDVSGKKRCSRMM